MRDGLFVIVICLGGIVLAFAAGVRDAERTCYRGSAPYLDCEFLKACPNPRVIDLAVEYAKTHPECRDSDTRPKDGDVKQAPLVSGAGPKDIAETPADHLTKGNEI